jgi:hypothetical protein
LATAMALLAVATNETWYPSGRVIECCTSPVQPRSYGETCTMACFDRPCKQLSHES